MARKLHSPLARLAVLAAVTMCLDLPASAFTPPPPVFITQWGSLGSGDGLFHDPFAIAIDGRMACSRIPVLVADDCARFVLAASITLLTTGVRLMHGQAVVR